MKRPIFLFFLAVMIVPFFTRGQSAADLQNQINQRQSDISKLDEAIKQYEQQITDTSKQADSLKNAVNLVNLNIKKLDSQISKTEKEIAQATAKIGDLNLNIKSTSQQIAEHQIELQALLRTFDRISQVGLTEQLLGDSSFADFWSEEERLASLSNRVREANQTLKQLKQDLGEKVTENETARTKLQTLRRSLADQKQIANEERARQSMLLAQTKNKEQNYRNLLDETRQRRETFARELFEFESQLKLKIDPNALPTVRPGVLRWPLAIIRITQYFGRTVAAARLYASGSHNGVDFGASLGTPVFAAATGVVAGTGDTDPVCRGASYGRWIALRHENGLATVYGHLSLSKVTAGQQVSVGEVIGYTGQSGYATGPHLHLTVAASQGMEIRSVPSKVCRGTYTMPVIDTRAYLDPILYLPS